MGDNLYGWQSLWVAIFMGGNLYGGNLYGWQSLWVAIFMGGNLYGWQSLWVVILYYDFKFNKRLS